MAIVNGYQTLEQMKLRLEIANDKFDSTLEAQIEVASRYIDGLCDRFFYASGATTVYFDVSNNSHSLPLTVDLLTITELATDITGFRDYNTIWAITDYDLLPTEAPLRGRPFTEIRRTPLGFWWFPRGTRSVKLTGTFGWPAVPKPIQEACALETARLFKRKTAPFGKIGSPAVGGGMHMSSIIKIDPDIEQLIGQYIRYGAELVDYAVIR